MARQSGWLIGILWAGLLGCASGPHTAVQVAPGKVAQVFVKQLRIVEIGQLANRLALDKARRLNQLQGIDAALGGLKRVVRSFCPEGYRSGNC